MDNKEKYSVLALEPYYGGSHKAFLDGWIENSRHDWTVLTLPAYKWRWRMRHAALTFAEQTINLLKTGKKWDIIFCSDMLNLAAFLGLAPEAVRKLPAIVYFHENQLTYPVKNEKLRDYQSVYINFTTGIAATRIWFNSAFNRDSFLAHLPGFLKRMPDYQHLEKVELLRDKSEVWHPGIAKFAERGERKPGPCRILWACRWEYDKNPEDFFNALKILKSENCEFRISVIGEGFRTAPPVFEWAHEYFQDHIDSWGYLESRELYEQELAQADVVVSTAIHEFFGIGILEAVAAGAFPLLPNRLAYPEIFSDENNNIYEQFFYDGSPGNLAENIAKLAGIISKNKSVWNGIPESERKIAKKYYWENISPALDDALVDDKTHPHLSGD